MTVDKTKKKDVKKGVKKDDGEPWRGYSPDKLEEGMEVTSGAKSAKSEDRESWRKK